MIHLSIFCNMPHFLIDSGHAHSLTTQSLVCLTFIQSYGNVDLLLFGRSHPIPFSTSFNQCLYNDLSLWSGSAALDIDLCTVMLQESCSCITFTGCDLNHSRKRGHDFAYGFELYDLAYLERLKQPEYIHCAMG